MHRNVSSGAGAPDEAMNSRPDTMTSKLGSVAVPASKLREFFLPFWWKLYRTMNPAEVDISHLYTAVPRKKGKIPNTVYQTWKSTKLPSLHARGVKRFRRLNPDYSSQFFDNHNAMNEYMAANYAGHPILDVFRAVRVPAARADIWRYCILFREGGIHRDIDSALSIRFRELRPGDYPSWKSVSPSERQSMQ